MLDSLLNAMYTKLFLKPHRVSFSYLIFVEDKDFCISNNFIKPLHFLLLGLCVCFGEGKKRIIQIFKIFIATTFSCIFNEISIPSIYTETQLIN